MKHMFFRLIAVIFALIITCSIIPAGSALTTVSRIDAHKAYYDYLKAEIEGLGGPVRDEDYYEMFTDHIKRPAITQKLLAVYLVDVTNDGIEELVIKRYVTHDSSAMLDSDDAEWVCIYSYVNGQIKRIGQNKQWIRPANATAWSYYEPDGYIGDILSFWQNPHISNDCVTLFWGKDGEVFLCDGEVLTSSECSFSFYSFNGTHMEREDWFNIIFVPEWTLGPIQSSYGYHIHEINGEKVEQKEFKAKVDDYTASGSYKLQNNDYNEVLNILSMTIQGKDVPYGDANPHCHIPSAEWISVGGQHYRTCQSGCDVKLDLDFCAGGIATCLEKATCSVCHQYYGDLKEHSPSSVYSHADGQHFFKCSITPNCTVVFDKEDCTDNNRDHKCDVCKKAGMGTHEAAIGTHICNYCGKRDSDSDCVDNIPDHKCDYCDTTLSQCIDDNRDHECDICKAAVGKHQAPYGSHSCSYCKESISECTDDNRDHKCDVCKKAGMGTHEAAVGTHICNYCGKRDYDSECVDNIPDHKCDYCDATLSKCTDNNRDHECDICKAAVGKHQAPYGSHSCNYCGEPLSECTDDNRDHRCDVCRDYISNHEAVGSHICSYCGVPVPNSVCVDNNRDHKCDICGDNGFGTHMSATGTHICDYCNAPASECTDKNKDHKCDRCKDSVGAHEAPAGKHVCNYCNESISECTDKNSDHTCDICGKSVGTHMAATGTHICDYCNAPASECTDRNRDHKCDACGTYLGTHEAADGTHLCDYCSQPISECEDDNKDHKCDVCGKDDASSSEHYQDNLQMGCSGTITGMLLLEIALSGVVTFVIVKKRKIKYPR